MSTNWLQDYQDSINEQIDTFFNERYKEKRSSVESNFEEALRYAVEGGGKRIRAILVRLGYEYAKNGKWEMGRLDQGIIGVTGEIENRESKIYNSEDSLYAAMIAVECIHAYTLVHDDLPCMDNDELRRGKPTVWKKYGETLAVLVGDTLQTLGFELLAQTGDIRVVSEFAYALGDFGVARGQVRDTLEDQKSRDLDDILRIHDEKTGIFIAASLRAGAMLGGAEDGTIAILGGLGFLLGRAFQVKDDILDFEGDEVKLGKKGSKDVDLGKGIVAKVGINETRILLISLEKEIEKYLQVLQDEKLQTISSYILNRES